MGPHGHSAFDHERPEGMPFIDSGGFKVVGVWPAPGKEQYKTNQPTYITLLKRHYDAVCIASVHVSFPDGSKWIV